MAFLLVLKKKSFLMLNLLHHLFSSTRDPVWRGECGGLTSLSNYSYSHVHQCQNV